VPRHTALRDTWLGWAVCLLICTQPADIDTIQHDEASQRRLEESFKMMMRFYGFEYHADATPPVTTSAQFEERARRLNMRCVRAETSLSSFERCFCFMSPLCYAPTPHHTTPHHTSWHNYLRITRILKSLALLGREDLQEQMMRALVPHVVGPRARIPNARNSLLKFWLPTLDNHDVRSAIYDLVDREQKRWREEADERVVPSFHR